MIRTGALALADQCLWSATNFLAVALFAHAADPETFGRFALAFTVIIFVSGLAAALSGEVLAVSRGDALNASGNGCAEPSPSQRAERRARAAGATALLAIVCPFGVLAVMAVATDGISTNELIAVAAAPAAIWAEGMRAMAYAERTPQRAIMISGSWVAGQGLATLATWLATGQFDGLTVLVGWFGGAALSAVAGLVTMTPRIRFSGATVAEWRRRRSFSFEYLVTAGAMNLTVMLSATMLGLAEAGAMRALQTVYGPLNILMVGVRNVVVPAAAESYRGVRLWLVANQVTFVLCAGTGVVWLILVSWPALGQLLMGENWPTDAGVVSGFSLVRLATAAMFGALIVFRALDATRLSIRLRSLSCAALLFPFVAGLRFGLDTALWAAGSASVAAACLWWWYARRAATESAV
jgi:hypothetical protein